MLLKRAILTGPLRVVSSLNSFNFSTEKRKVVLFPGNGIGPEIAQSVIDIFSVLKVPIEFEHHQIYTSGQTADGDLISSDSINRVQ